LEDPNHHRLTARDAFIDAEPSVVEQQSSSIGYWYHMNATTTPKPLFTRYQTSFCRVLQKKYTKLKKMYLAEVELRGSQEVLLEMQEVDRQFEACKNKTDLSRFHPYRFTFHKGFDWKKRLEGREREKVCFVGASHARFLTGHSEEIVHLQLGNIRKGIELLHVVANRPQQFAQSTVRSTFQDIVYPRCTKVVVGWGQWDLDINPMKPSDANLFPQYEHDLKTAMDRLVAVTNVSGIDLYFRTTHYNPLKGNVVTCPPNDWRSPPMIDMYNNITKHLCEEFGIPLIDTGDIHNVMWDRAEDWCHYGDLSGKMEALYILDRIFSRDKEPRNTRRLT